MALKFSNEQEFQEFLKQLPDREIGKSRDDDGAAGGTAAASAPKKARNVNPRKVSTVNSKMLQKRIDEVDINNDNTFQKTLGADFDDLDKRITLQSKIATKQLDVMDNVLSESKTSAAVLEQLKKIVADENKDNVKTNAEILDKLTKTLEVEKELLKKNKGTMTKDDIKVLTKGIEQAKKYQQYVPDESAEVMHKAKAWTPSSYMAGRKYRESMAEFEKKAKEEGREVTSKEKRQAMMAGAAGGMKEAAGIKQDEKLMSKRGVKGMASAGLGAAMHGAGAYFEMPLLNIMASGWNQRRRRIAEAERQYEKQQKDLKDSADLSYAQGILNTKGGGIMQPSSSGPVMSTVPSSPAGGGRTVDTSANNLQELKDDTKERADEMYKKELIAAIGRVEAAVHELGGKIEKQPKESAKINRREAKGEGKPQGLSQPKAGEPTKAKNEAEKGITGIPILDNLLGNAFLKKFPGLGNLLGMGGSSAASAAGTAGAAGAGGAAAGGLGALLTGGAGAAFASSPALVAALVAAAGAGGYGIGTVLNKGINWGTQKITGDKDATLGSKFYDWMHGGGDAATTFETGQKDPRKAAATISSGKGDYGGKSYGSYQLSSKQGQVDAFLKSSGYANQFQGLQVGTKEFDQKWKQLASSDDNFASAQKQYAIQSKAVPQMQQLRKKGYDLSNRGKAVQEMVLSTANQYGANTSVIQKALEQAAANGEDVSKLTDAQLIKRVQDYKAANVDTNFKSSSKDVRAGVAQRIQDEKGYLLAMANQEARAKGQTPTQVALATPAPAVNTDMQTEKKGEKKSGKKVKKGKAKGPVDEAPVPQNTDELMASAPKAASVDQIKAGTKDAYEDSETNLQAKVKAAKRERFEENIAQQNGGGATTTKSDRGGGSTASHNPSSLPPITTGDGNFAALLYSTYQRS